MADWRSQLQPGARSRIVNKIMETLKKGLAVPDPEGMSKLHRLAVRFEENIYTAAISQDDYLRKITLKMLSMECQLNTRQNAGNAQVIPNQNPPGPGTLSLVDSPVKMFKEPKFTCPICMNELTEASSTICGHVFCEKCIRAAVQVQKKCPICRKELNICQQHRVYLPTTE